MSTRCINQNLVKCTITNKANKHSLSDVTIDRKYLKMTRRHTPSTHSKCNDHKSNLNIKNIYENLNKSSVFVWHIQHTKPLFKKSNILTIHNLYFYATACEVIKIINSKKPRAIYDLFQISSTTKLILPKFNAESCKSKIFTFNSSKIMNYLMANHIKYTSTLSTFKLNLKRFFNGQAKYFA